ncbi:dihydroorotate dehydrogenase [Nocardia yunnanensis]|uniref:Dihydroorotate dehydrogenase n=1 Tax=Nocardia yunnanensis TaxID=2382165 RepID=A0A386ZEY5_9NOCA|nr:DUF5703 family protein [Nocardia yunnanensis]AYF75763.1 dihydroorotate dehydrogenase [Nocardia yunnanensis]
MARASRSAHQSRTLPEGWEESSDEWEYVPLRLPPGVSRVTAALRLSIHAEYSGWELSRVRAYTDGSRRVLLRRRRSNPPLSPTPEAVM